MEEENLRASCGAHSFYISLQDQKSVNETISRSTGPTVSKEQTTQIHLAVRHHQHWAAVQISVSPFDIAAIPEQKFLQCCLRHTWCCEGAVGESLEQEPWKSVQRVYDSYYGPTWNFSSEYCRSTDPPASISHPNELTCEKRAEHALASYIQRGKERENLPEDSNLDGVHDEVANQLKRRELDTSHDQNHEIGDDVDIRNGSSVGAWSTVHTHGTKRRRLRSSSDLMQDRSSSRNGENNSTGNTAEVQSTAEIQSAEFQPAEFRSAKINPSVQQCVEEISAKIAKKILSGLDGMRPKEKKRPKKTGKTKPNAAVIDGVIDRAPPIPNGNIPTVFRNCVDRGVTGLDDRLAYLEIFLLEQSSSVTKSAHETVWKWNFLVACVRRLRNHDLSSSVKGCKATRVRWIYATRIVNSVVEGLWCTWGPRAALVYEALASKNYCLNHISQLAVSTMDSVIHSVIRQLAATPPPPSSLRAHVFQPAAYISIATDTEYVEVLMMLILEPIADKPCEYSYVAICNRLELTSFSKLSFDSELSVLICQWDRHKAATSPGSGPQGFSEPGAPYSSKIDTLADVAVAEIGRNTTTAIGSKARISVDAAQCMKRVPHKVHTSGQTAFISGNLETEARSSLHVLGAEYQHRANRPQATTNVLDGAMTDCIDPRLTSLLHSSRYLPSVEPSSMDGAICPSVLMIDPVTTDSLQMSDTLPNTLGPSSGEEAIHPTTGTMVPPLTSSLHKSSDVPRALDSSTDQGATGTTASMVDPYLTDSLYTSGYLPSAVETSSPSLD
ncbi:hypothetical protein V492_05414 [Pseudogymnoascus sp. VKM F-4246]|nr:hypothetical protein V492_05414 [Pseudogymnoascus sp. VKM F-4246]